MLLYRIHKSRSGKSGYWSLVGCVAKGHVYLHAMRRGGRASENFVQGNRWSLPMARRLCIVPPAFLNAIRQGDFSHHIPPNNQSPKAPCDRLFANVFTKKCEF